MNGRSWRRRAGRALVATAVAAGGLVVASGAPAHAATTIHVPADQPTIAAALAVAVNGDTVEVAPGTYLESLNFDGKDVRLVSTSGPSVTTIRPGTTPVILGPGGSIEGFTVSGGRGNEAGALIVGGGTGGLIRGNRFISNNGGYGYGGAAIKVESSATIEQNWFEGNGCLGDTQFRAGVVSVQSYVAAVTVRNNVFVDNPCLAAINLGSDPSHQVLNNTIVGGEVGIWITTDQTFVIRNNLIAGSATGIRSEPQTAWPIVDHNLIWATVHDYEGGLPDQTGMNGNISADPKFISPLEADYRLQAGSPAVDAGSATGAPAVDFDGSPRPLDGPDADLDAEFDMGAHERDGTEPLPPTTGILDPGFSQDGLALYPSKYAIATGPGAPNRLYIGAFRESDGGRMRISRLESSGQPSTGFGGTGTVLRNFAAGGGVAFPTDVIESGSNVVIAGEHYGSYARLGVTRLKTNGALDPYFSGDGMSTWKIFDQEHDALSPWRVRVLSGGKVAVALSSYDQNSSGNYVFTGQALLRLTTWGAADTTFSQDGKAVIPNDWSDVAFMMNGAMYAGRKVGSIHEVRKLLPSGQLDTSFSGDGIASVNCGTHRGAVMTVDGAGRPTLLCVRVVGGTLELLLFRFTASGALDPAYSGDGKTTLVLAGGRENGGAFLHFASDATLWASIRSATDTNSILVFSLTANGEPNTAWNGDGVARVKLPWPARPEGLSVDASRVMVSAYKDANNVALIALKR